MRDKLVRSIAFAVVAAISISIAPSFANETVKAFHDDTTILADGMCQRKQRRIYKRPVVKRVYRPAPPKTIERIVRIETEKIIEKPVIIEKEVQVAAPVIDEEVCIPAVVETATPVVIDRYEKRRRSLIHLGLFPFSLFGN